MGDSKVRPGEVNVMRSLILCIFFALVPVVHYAVAAPYKAASGPHQVEVRLGEWSDAGRQGRVVPWKLYWPREDLGLIPVVVWSHGAGGSRDGAEYLGRHLASHGFAAFHIQHAGSDIGVLRKHGAQGMLDKISDPQVVIARLGDVPFAVSQIEKMATDELAGRLDSSRIGMSGHSYGAITTLVAAGQSMPLVGRRFAVPAFRGAFAMSPSKPRSEDPSTAFAVMDMPLFHLTGTADASPLGDQTVETRSFPFDTIEGRDQWLLVLEDGIHMTFSGRQIGQPGPARDKAARHHELVRMAAVAFWDMLLKEDPQAAAWLRSGGFDHELEPADGTLRFKPGD